MLLTLVLRIAFTLILPRFSCFRIFLNISNIIAILIGKQFLYLCCFIDFQTHVDETSGTDVYSFV